MRWKHGVTGILMLVGLATSGAAGAATIGVTATVDEFNDSNGDCTLREAVRSANGNSAVDGCTKGDPGRDTIQLPAGTYTLSLTGTENDDASANDLDVTESVVFEALGNGAVTVEPADAAAFSDRAFHLVFTDLTPGDGVVMRGFTVRGFQASGNGGAVFAARPLEVIDMSFIDNVSTNNRGGAIFYRRASGGEFRVDRSAFIDNRAPHSAGGAFAISFTNDSGFVTDSTFARNHAGGNGGAIHVVDDPLVLRNVTIAENSTDGDGGGIYVGTDGEMLLRNAILDGNRGLGAGSDCAFGGNGAITGSSADGSTAFNLISDASGCGGIESFPDTITGQSARLAMTGHYDGDTPFRPLLADSPAIDAGSCSTGGSSPVNIGTDQRQVSRITAGSTCDIGAAERNWKPYTVDSTGDTGDAADDDVCDDGAGRCTLRAAIDEANEGVGMDEIILPEGAIILSLASTEENNNLDGDLDVRDSLVVHGAGVAATAIDANGIDRVLNVPGNGISAPPTLALSDLTVRGGDSGAPAGTSSLDNRGGGVLIDGLDSSALLLERVRIRGNRAAGGAGSGFGGGVFVDAGVLRAHAALFDANEAKTSNSAIALAQDSSGHLERVTVTGNHAIDNSAAVGATGDSVLRIEHSSVVDNMAIQNAQFSTNATIEIHASIVAGSPGDNCGPFLSGTIVDLGDNLEDGTDCGFAGGQSANVDLASLADVGGPVPLREPNAGSDAVDAAGTDACTASTGRLLARLPFGGIQPQDADATGGTTGDGIYACDVGAAERQQVRLANGPAAPSDRPVAAGSTGVVMAQITATNESGEPLDRAATELTLRAAGSGIDNADVTAVRLYYDANDDGQLDAGDVQRGATRTFAGDDGRIAFSFGNSPGGAPGDLQSGGSANYLVVYDFASRLADAAPLSIEGRSARAGLAGGSGALALLGAMFGLSGLRRRPALFAVPVIVATLMLAACGGGSGGGSGGGTGGSGSTGGASATFAVVLDDASVTGATSGRVIDLSTPSVEGATVTVEE